MQQLSAILFQGFSLVLVLGLVVLVHEYGHYLAARLVGVRVEVFSVGFGSRLAGWRRGDTEFRISWIPLGGYVRMAGEGSLESEPTGAPDELESRRAWEKLLIFGAGPAMNLVLAVVLSTAAFMAGTVVPAWLSEPVVVAAVEPGSPAEAAGLQEGDRIVGFDGRPAGTWESFQEDVLVRPGARVELDVLRGVEDLKLPIVIGKTERHRVGHVGLIPWCRLELARVDEASPAAEAGLMAGDVVLAVDGKRTCHVLELAAILNDSGPRPRRFLVDRAGEQLEAELAPRWDAELEAWRIGVLSARIPVVEQRHGLRKALVASLEHNWRLSELLLVTLGRLVTGRMSLRATSGPVEIASIASDAVRLGLVPVLQFMSLISLNLGILNLLPIPILDGGRMVIVGLEAVRGRELGETARDWVLRAGLLMIVALMVVVLFLDIIKKIEG